MSYPKRHRLIPISIYEIDPDNDVQFPIAHNQITLITTAIPLGGLASYTSAIIDVSRYTAINGSCYADQDGTIIATFSQDAINFDSSSSVSYFAGDQYGFSGSTESKYFRIIFQNGALAQTTFRLNIIGSY